MWCHHVVSPISDEQIQGTLTGAKIEYEVIYLTLDILHWYCGCLLSPYSSCADIKVMYMFIVICVLYIIVCFLIKFHKKTVDDCLLLQRIYICSLSSLSFSVLISPPLLNYSLSSSFYLFLLLSLYLPIPWRLLIHSSGNRCGRWKCPPIKNCYMYMIHCPCLILHSMPILWAMKKGALHS